MKKPGAIIIEGHVQGLSNMRSLGELGISVIVVDTGRCIAQHSRYCTGFYQCPDYHTEEFASFLLQLEKKQNLKDWVLFPSNDHAVYTIAKHKKKLERVYNVITPGLEVIDIIYDKSKLIKIAQSTNVPAPKTWFISEPDSKVLEELTYPVLTKGRNGLTFYKITGRKAFLSQDQERLKNQLKKIREKVALPKTFTQELIPDTGTNKTVSFTAFCIDGEIKTHWAGVKLREHPLRFGTATFAKSVFIPECLEQSKKLLKALHYTGVCEVEYLLDPRDGIYKLIEVNARTWLWVELARACGVDYAKLMYDHTVGNEPVFPDSYEIGKYWRNPVTDTFYGFIEMIKGEITIGEYLSLFLLKNQVNALFKKEDIKPMLFYFFYLLKFKRNR